MNRCLFCQRHLWWWQSQGWLVGVGRWHGQCMGAEHFRDSRRPSIGELRPPRLIHSSGIRG